MRKHMLWGVPVGLAAVFALAAMKRWARPASPEIDLQIEMPGDHTGIMVRSYEFYESDDALVGMRLDGEPADRRASAEEVLMAVFTARAAGILPAARG